MMRRVVLAVGLTAAVRGAIVDEEAPTAPASVIASQKLPTVESKAVIQEHYTVKGDVQHGLKIAHVTAPSAVVQEAVKETVAVATDKKAATHDKSPPFKEQLREEQSRESARDDDEDEDEDEDNDEDDDNDDEDKGCEGGGCVEEDDDHDEDDDDDHDDDHDEDEDEDDDSFKRDEDDENDDEEEGGQLSHDALFQRMKFEEGSSDQDEVFQQAKQKNKPALVVITKQTCPHCTELAESMQENGQIKKLMKKFVNVHVKDNAGEQWGDDTYVPRSYFFDTEGAQIDIHSANKKYPYYFKNSASLLNGMKKALKEL